MKILVLGGTGAMGKPVVEILAARGHRVYVTTRKEYKSDNFNIVYVRGNAHDMIFISEILKEQYDAIIDFMIYSPEEFVVNSALFLEKTRQYIFLSSARVYADSADAEIAEEHPRLLDVTGDKEYLETNEYALAKAREEDILSKGSKRNYTIIRPYITYNNERLQLGAFEKEAWLYRALRGKAIVFSKDIAEKTTTMTYGYDVALHIADLIGKECALGELYNIATDVSIQWQEVLEIYLNTLEKNIGKRPNVFMLESCDRYTEKVAYYQVHYDRLFNRRFNIDKVRRDTDERKPFTRPQEGLVMCLEAFLKEEHNLFSAVDWRREGAFDRITGDREKMENIIGVKNKVKYIMYRYLKKKDFS